MSNQSDYIKPIHIEDVSRLINPPSDGAAPNTVLRTMIVESLKTGRKINNSQLAREYCLKTGKRVSSQWVGRVVKRMGVYAK